LLSSVAHQNPSMNEQKSERKLSRSDLNKLRSAYLNLNSSSAFSSANVLIDKFKNKIDSNLIRNWLLGQEVYALHHPRKLRFKKLYSYSFEPGFFHIDLSPNTESLAINNGNNHYLLVICDSFTRKIDAELIKNKTSESVIKAFKKLMKRHKFKIVYSDFGTEFVNNKFEQFLKSNNIRHFYARNPTTKAFFAEWAIKVLRSRIYKYLEFNKTKSFAPVLSKIVDAINNTKQKKLGFAPNKIKDKNSMREAFHNLYFKNITQERKQPKLHVGSLVRVINFKVDTFSKNYNRDNYTKEIFKIVDILPKKLPLYKIADLKGNVILGTYYESELLPFPNHE
jgi:hypothetical protein